MNSTPYESHELAQVEVGKMNLWRPAFECVNTHEKSQHAAGTRMKSGCNSLIKVRKFWIALQPTKAK